MKKMREKLDLSALRQKILAASVSAILTGGLASGIAQASDVDVYQTAKSGDITLMFMLDISGSMENKDGGKITRINRVKTAMQDLLAGNAAAGITRISDDKIIGLSTLGAVYQKCDYYGYCYNNTANTGAILVPARRLDEKVGEATQRQILLNAISGLSANTATPTARSYAEVVSYLMGTNTKGKTGNGYSYSWSETKDANNYIAPASLAQTADQQKCSGQGVYVLTDGEPNNNSSSSGLMKAALGTKGSLFACSDSDSGWNCTHNMSQALLDPTANPQQLKFKTAVVGFGKDFNNVASYDKNKTQEENINALGSINTDVKRAAYWGIIGQGGWYSGNNSEDVVNSVNDFISNLGKDIPSVTTGTPTIPNDELNPSILQKFAYYPQFQPTPGQTYQLWLGNLKKYNVNSSGRLTDSNKDLIVSSKGEILAERVDLWAPALDASVAEGDINTKGSKLNRFMGGVKSQLLLRATGTTVNRKLLTNRISSGAGFVSGNTQLQAITLDYLTTAALDPARGHLMALLGYDVDPTTPAGLANITKAKLSAATQPAELRQVGAVMHSSPLLLTSQGKITYNDSTGELGSEQRNDYVVFGTTQGVLHAVDADTGIEKFAFVPNEIIENQKLAFLKPEMGSAGLGSMFYGIDAPWTVYSEYVLDNSGKLTVGTGLNSEKGAQNVYGGLRMGGRGYYALDLSNMDSPKLLFNINPDGASSGPLSYMGQSWSKPAIGWVKWGKTKRLVMFVGGGYDAGGVDGNAKGSNGVKGTYAGYEGDGYNQGTNGRGAGVYMFDALTGEHLWWASSKAATSDSTADSGTIGLKDSNMKYSVVSEITTADRDSDGLIDHLYFGDLGGQVFRIDINNKAAAQGGFARSHRIFNLSQTDGKAPRFYEAPAFSIYDVEGKTFAVISIGSGNRSTPLQEYTVGASGRDYDAIYNIYDKDVTNPELYTMTDNKFVTKDIDLNLSTGLKAIVDTNRFGVSKYVNLIAPYSSSGWYYQFKSNLLQSEKVYATPIVINNDMYVTTFDGSKPGLSGDCGAGVKGESFLTKFCMPFGQCAQAGQAGAYKLNIGAGITGGSVGAGEKGTARLIVVNTDTAGLTGGSAITGARYDTGMKLVAQRWYEKYK